MKGLKIGFNIIMQIVVWVLVIAFFSYITSLNIKRLNTIEAEKIEIQTDIEQAKNLTERLKKDSEYYESDEFVEKIAREQLGLAKRDEIIFIKK